MKIYNPDPAIKDSYHCAKYVTKTLLRGIEFCRGPDGGGGDGLSRSTIVCFCHSFIASFLRLASCLFFAMVACNSRDIVKNRGATVIDGRS